MSFVQGGARSDELSHCYLGTPSSPTSPSRRRRTQRTPSTARPCAGRRSRWTWPSPVAQPDLVGLAVVEREDVVGEEAEGGRGEATARDLLVGDTAVVVESEDVVVVVVAGDPGDLLEEFQEECAAVVVVEVDRARARHLHSSLKLQLTSLLKSSLSSYLLYVDPHWCERCVIFFPRSQMLQGIKEFLGPNKVCCKIDTKPRVLHGSTSSYQLSLILDYHIMLTSRQRIAQGKINQVSILYFKLKFEVNFVVKMLSHILKVVKKKMTEMKKLQKSILGLTRIQIFFKNAFLLTFL